MATASTMIAPITISLALRRHVQVDQAGLDDADDEDADERAPDAAHAARKRRAADDHGGHGDQRHIGAVLVGARIQPAHDQDTAEGRQEPADGVDRRSWSARR